MSDFSSSSTSPINSTRPGHRLWLPIAIGILALGGLAAVHLQPELERNLKSWMTAAVVLIAALLALIWFLFFSRFPGRIRLAILGILVLSIFGLKETVRVTGTADGTGLPKLGWRWSETAHAPLLAVSTAATVKTAVQETPFDVPQFFGPHRDGTVKNAGLARDWQTVPPKQLWRQPVGAGWSSIAVVGERAFTQEQRGEMECIACYGLLTGQLLWTHTNPVHFQQWQGGDGPRATPTVDRGRVFAIGATGILDCLDAATGERIWSRHVLEENKLDNLIWGVSGSPLVFDDTVVVTGGLTDGPTVLAYRRSTGEPLWHSGTDKASYASPVLATLAGRRVVLSCNAASVTACDVATGEQLLNYPWSDGKWPKAAQPIVLAGDRVFISAGYGTGCALLEIKAAEEGKLAATTLWKNLRMKTQFNSAAARDGFLYGLDDGMLACVDIATGERKWKGGRFGSGQSMLVDDLLIVQSESGPVVLAEATPAGFQELARLPALQGKTWNYPTVAGRHLLVRNSEEMACYELPLQRAAVAAGNRP